MLDSFNIFAMFFYAERGGFGVITLGFLYEMGYKLAIFRKKWGKKEKRVGKREVFIVRARCYLGWYG